MTEMALFPEGWLDSIDYERELVLTYTTEMDELAGGNLSVLAKNRERDAAELLVISADLYEGHYELPEEPEEFAYMMDEFPVELSEKPFPYWGYEHNLW